jgi:hypothetical protein
MLDQRLHMCRLFQQQSVVLMLMANSLKKCNDGVSVLLAIELEQQVLDNVRCIEAILPCADAETPS